MKKVSICLIVCFVVMLIACVPQSVQLKGTWEFVGYKAERVESIIEVDSTICFDGDGNGFYYRSNDSSAPKSFTYLLSTDHKLAIIIDGASSVVEYSIDPKTKRLSLDGLEYRLISSEVDAVKKAEAEQSPTSTPTLTPESSGKTVQFGHYEQDDNITNGKESIEWIVLAKEGSRALLISKYALDCQPYNTTKTGVTWETCSLRKWLNESFLNSAFSKSEQNMIITATIKADMNPYFITEPGNDTRDKIFILSIKEAIKYLDNYEARKCAPTYYAIAQGAATSNKCYKDGRAACWWWLRSPGYDSIVAARVDCDGSVFSEGRNVNLNVVAVRPAVWINPGS